MAALNGEITFTGTDTTLSFQQDGLFLSSFSTNGQRVTLTALTTEVVLSREDYTLGLNLVEQWRQMVESFYSASAEPQTIESSFKWEIESNPAEVEFSLTLGTEVIKASYDRSLFLFTILPRPALDLAWSDFILLFIGAFRRLNVAVRPGIPII